MELPFSYVPDHNPQPVTDSGPPGTPDITGQDRGRGCDDVPPTRSGLSVHLSETLVKGRPGKGDLVLSQRVLDQRTGDRVLTEARELFLHLRTQDAVRTTSYKLPVSRVLRRKSWSRLLLRHTKRETL